MSLPLCLTRIFSPSLVPTVDTSTINIDDSQALHVHMHIGALFEDLVLRPTLLEFVDALLFNYTRMAAIMHDTCDKALLEV